MNINFLFVNNYLGILENSDCGASVRSTMLIDSLARIGHVDIINFSEKKILSSTGKYDVIYDNYISDDEAAKRQQRLFTRLRKYILPFSPQSHFTVCMEKERIIDTFIEGGKKRYDYIVCRYIHQATICGLMKYGDRLVIDIDDNLYSATIASLLSIKPYYAWKYITGLYRAITTSITLKRMLENVRVSFYSNKLEPPHKKSIYLHNVPGIIAEAPSFICKENHRILVVGWLDYAPNRYGIKHFVERIFPEIRRAVPDVTLHIAGKAKDKQMIDWINTKEGVSALGFVDDLSKEYTDAQIVAIPLYHGSGTSVKFTEAISMAKPVVSTPTGVRGFCDVCKEDVHFLCAYTDQEFIKKTIGLLNSASKCETLQKNAFNVAKAHLSKDHFCEIVKNAFTQLKDKQ